MSKKKKKDLDSNKKSTPEITEHSDKVEYAFKIMLRVMSWGVGIAFGAILILPEFNSPLLDKITKVLFYIGFVDLLLFLIIEFVGDQVKTFMGRFIHE